MFGKEEKIRIGSVLSYSFLFTSNILYRLS
jgi:hypothetical protein